MKLCYRCGAEKPLTEFYRKNARCKACCISLARERAIADHEAYKDRLRKYGRDNVERLRAYKKEYHQRTRDETRAARRKRLADWRKRNPERYRAQLRRRRIDPAKAAEHVRRSQAAKTRQCPQWADREAILEIYREARRLTRETGMKYTVDHIVPLQHTRVAGLHCEANLQILTHAENSGKRNLWWPGM